MPPAGRCRMCCAGLYDGSAEPVDAVPGRGVAWRALTRRKRHIWIIVAGVLVLGAGAAVVRSRNQATPVLTVRVVTQDIVSKVTANGKIQAENKVEMSALVQGQVVNLAVREGDKVRKGAERDSAGENMAQAERDFERRAGKIRSGRTSRSRACTTA